MNRTHQRVSVLTSGAAIFAMITVMVGGGAQAAPTPTVIDTGTVGVSPQAVAITSDVQMHRVQCSQRFPSHGVSFRSNEGTLR